MVQISVRENSPIRSLTGLAVPSQEEDFLMIMTEHLTPRREGRSEVPRPEDPPRCLEAQHSLTLSQDDRHRSRFT